MWDDRGYRYDMMDGGGALMWLAVVLLVLLLVAVSAVVVHLFLHSGSGRADVAVPPAPHETDARRLLDRRLAMGEITVEEYATVRSALEP